jgi:hypothetical protein
MASNEEERIKETTKIYCRLTIISTIILTLFILFILFHIVYVEILRKPRFIGDGSGVLVSLILCVHSIIVIVRGVASLNSNINNNNKLNIFNNVIDWLLLPISLIMLGYFIKITSKQ